MIVQGRLSLGETLAIRLACAVFVLTAGMLFGISAEALNALDGATLQALNQSGFLALAFQVMTSLGNVSKIIEMKNRKRHQV
ncbi:MAG: hypothetical protein B7Z26_02240 [Asticcacaulis sp. 32-58-5]|nr:MAG: hypothetical protein B7Z26_02240 [Asticcacaulis sp. 32-58-5]